VGGRSAIGGRALRLGQRRGRRVPGQACAGMQPRHVQPWQAGRAGHSLDKSEDVANVQEAHGHIQPNPHLAVAGPAHQRIPAGGGQAGGQVGLWRPGRERGSRLAGAACI
jgi:hypothetical protein